MSAIGTQDRVFSSNRAETTMSGFLENKLAMRPPCSGFRSPLTRFFKLGQMLDSLQHAATGYNAPLIVSHMTIQNALLPFQTCAFPLLFNTTRRGDSPPSPNRKASLVRPLWLRCGGKSNWRPQRTRLSECHQAPWTESSRRLDIARDCKLPRLLSYPRN